MPGEGRQYSLTIIDIDCLSSSISGLSIYLLQSLKQSPLYHDVGGAVRVPVVAGAPHPDVAAAAHAGLEQGVDVVGLGEALEEGDEVEELAVVHVVEPRGHGNLECKMLIDSFATPSESSIKTELFYHYRRRLALSILPLILTKYKQRLWKGLNL